MADVKHQTDKEILGYSRWVVFIAAFLSMGVISPYEYAWSSMSGHIGGIYGWSHTQIGWMFTLFVIFESVGTLPGGILRDKFGPKWVTAIAGLIAGLGIFATSLGPGYGLVLVLWCVGSFLAGFVYNTAVTTANKWFPDKRGLTAGLIAGAFSWGSLPFIFPIRAIPKTAPDATFFHVIYFMAAIIGGVCIVAALFMKDPPTGWRPQGWVPAATTKRSTDHQFTLKEALGTWQMWVLIASFILISSAGLAGVSKIVKYSNSFHFTAAAATAAAGGIAISNGLGRVILGALSERIGRETAMIWSYILTGVFLFLTLIAGAAQSEFLFVVAAILAIFFWGPLFSLFPATIGQYFGEASAGSNYGLLYAIAKGSGGIYGGVLSAVLIASNGFPFAIGVGAVMAICAGLLIIPLKNSPPVWKGAA
ncbi:MAG TPA: OFA family MFS transporter, partial [Alphaproteobacteria bacterium]|nr:OFA family MFS transporter [Alphaproteobacteria bacterium]